jgi:hypothetical protein
MLKRLMILSVPLTGLAGCAGPSLSDNQRAEVENIAEDLADGAASTGDTSGLEERVEKLERQAKLFNEAHDLHFKNIGELSKDGVTDADNISKLSQELTEHERLYHGVR